MEKEEEALECFVSLKVIQLTVTMDLMTEILSISKPNIGDICPWQWLVG